MSDCCKDNMTSTTVFGDDYEYRIDFCAECGDTSGEIELQAKFEELQKERVDMKAFITRWSHCLPADVCLHLAMTRMTSMEVIFDINKLKAKVKAEGGSK
jgi:hypothetical protein